MYIRIVGEGSNVLFECDRVIETKFSLSFWKEDEIFVELEYDKEERLRIYAMNSEGKTIDNWNIFPEGK